MKDKQIENKSEIVLVRCPKAVYCDYNLCEHNSPHRCLFECSKDYCSRHTQGVKCIAC